MMNRLALPAVLLANALLAGALWAADTGYGVGGANSPKPQPPPKLVIETAELSAGAFAVKVPTGAYTAPPGGAPAYSVPGPIVSFRGADGVWRGHGYLETYPRLLKFTGNVTKDSADLDYQFESDKRYQVKLAVVNGALQMDETSNLGPRNVYVLDCFYGGDASPIEKPFAASSGFALDLAFKTHAFLYLPCYYDKPEVTINPAGKPPATAPLAEDEPPPTTRPFVKAGAVAVLSADTASKDVAGFWARRPDGWKNGDTMGIQLWQHRQRPGDPDSRHFLGPDTKSDSTPNPRTAGLMGQSLYEGHVTIELNLGVGTRQLGFAAAAKGDTREALAEPFEKLVRANP